MKKVLLAGLFVLLFGTAAQAQTIGRWDLKIFNAGAQNPLSTTPVTVAAAQCNLTTGAPGGGTANPTDLWWNDPVNVGKFCHYVSQPSDPLIAMPITGNPLEATLVAVSTTNLVSADSARVPFTKPGTAPAVPTGFTLR